MVDIVQQVSTDIVLSDKSEAEAGTNNTKFMTPLRTKEAIDKNTSNLLPNTSIVQVEGNATDKVMSQAATTASIATAKTELTNQIGAAVLPFNAMSQSQFEAIRAANNEEFAASGFVHFGKHVADSASYTPINEGAFVNDGAPFYSSAGMIILGELTSSKDGKSKTDHPVLNIAGVRFDVLGVASDATKNSVRVKFPQAPDGKTTYNKSTGAIVTHVDSTTAFAAQQADPTNVEVVIDRVDMWGFESWLEEVNTTNPYIYPNGLIQSQATAMDGITTSASARPVTYYAVFDGDTGSKGKGVNFFTLTDAQKKKALGNHKNNLYYLDDGRLVQWRLRQKTYQGFGNGDWFNIESQKGNLQFKSGLAVNSTLGSSWVADSQNIGVFKDSSGSLFLVCGTVNRLNSGAYHPSFNPSGASQLTNYGGMNATLWHAGNQPLVSQTAQCFNYGQGYPVSGGNVTTPTVYVTTGEIGGYSGRPDGRLYDAIYASGQGGVCRDMRYSANGLTPTDFAEADQRVKNGTYRGFELIPITIAGIATPYLSGLVVDLSKYGNVSQIKNTPHSPTEGSNAPRYKVCNTRTRQIVDATGWTVGLEEKVYLGVLSDVVAGDKILVLANNTSGQLLSNSSVGGSFLQTDIIGSPERILATPQLANGWQGSWIPVIPDGTSKRFTVSRKNVGPSIGTESYYTINNGESWLLGKWNIEGVLNGVTSTEPASRITIVPYQAFAKQTKPSANAVVYGGRSGVGVVATGCAYYVDRGVLLAESLINKIMTNSNIQNIHNSNLAVIESRIGNDTSKFDPADWGYPRHYPLSYVAPTNNSAAFKALNYNVNINQQGLINYAYTELKHNGTNWGDDSKVTIVDNQSTKTDLNGNTVLVGTAQLNEPIGWIKLKV